MKVSLKPDEFIEIDIPDGSFAVMVNHNGDLIRKYGGVGSFAIWAWGPSKSNDRPALDVEILPALAEVSTSADEPTDGTSSC